MKLRNKKTGEIREIREILIDGMFKVSSLAELNEEWEDYEEQKAYYIERCGTIEEFDTTKDVALTEMLKEIGNYFETEEEAEKAVEKIKAWKRLKDKGFKFVGWEDTNNDVNDILFELPYMEWDKNVIDDLDSLFGGER